MSALLAGSLAISVFDHNDLWGDDAALADVGRFCVIGASLAITAASRSLSRIASRAASSGAD